MDGCTFRCLILQFCNLPRVPKSTGWKSCELQIFPIPRMSHNPSGESCRMEYNNHNTSKAQRSESKRRRKNSRSLLSILKKSPLIHRLLPRGSNFTAFNPFCLKGGHYSKQHSGQDDNICRLDKHGLNMG